MLTNRVLDWRNVLGDLIEANRFRPFEWGQHDCALWAASAIAAVTGQDPAEAVRGTYKGKLGARQRIKRYYGCEDLQQVMTKITGKEPVHVAFARAGDIVSADLNRLGIGETVNFLGMSLGVCNGARSFFVGETADRVGLIELDTLALDCAHHV